MFWSNHILFHEVPLQVGWCKDSCIQNTSYLNNYLSLVRVIWLTFTGSNGSGWRVLGAWSERTLTAKCKSRSILLTKPHCKTKTPHNCWILRSVLPLWYRYFPWSRNDFPGGFSRNLGYWFNWYIKPSTVFILNQCIRCGNAKVQSAWPTTNGPQVMR